MSSLVSGAATGGARKRVRRLARPSQLIAEVDNILAWFARYDDE